MSRAEPTVRHALLRRIPGRHLLACTTGRAHRRSDQARAEGKRLPAHDQGRRQRLHLRGFPRRRREVHDDQHVRRHRDGVLVADGQGNAADDERAGRRDSDSHDATDQVRRHLLRPRRPHGRQRVVPRRRHLHHPPDVEGHPRALGERAGSRRPARCSCRRSTRSTLGGETDRHPLPRPRAHRRRPERQPAAPEDSVSERDVPEPRVSPRCARHTRASG